MVEEWVGHPTVVSDQTGDQHKEEVPGWCGCVLCVLYFPHATEAAVC